MPKNTLHFSVILAWLPPLLLCVLSTDYRSVHLDVTFMGLITNECWRATVLLWNTFHKTRMEYSLPLFSTSFRCQLLQGMLLTCDGGNLKTSVWLWILNTHSCCGITPSRTDHLSIAWCLLQLYIYFFFWQPGKGILCTNSLTALK